MQSLTNQFLVFVIRNIQFVLVVLAIFSPTLLFSQDIIGSGRAGTRDEALSKAKTDALRKGVSQIMSVDASQAGSFFGMMDQKVDVIIQNPIITSEQNLGNGFKVDITVDLSSLMDKMAEDADLRDLALKYVNRPRLMIIAREGMTNGDRVEGTTGNWTESGISKYLLERGFQLIDNKQFEYLKQRDVTTKILENPDEIGEIAAKAFDQGAEYLIDCQSLFESKNISRGGLSLNVGTVNLTAKIVRTSDGSTIATNTVKGVKNASQLSVALQRATEEATTLISEYLVKQAVAKWTLESLKGSRATLIVSGIDFRGVRDLKGYLEQMSDVSEVNFRAFKNNVQEVDVLVKGDIMNFAFAFDGVALPSGLLSVTTADNSRIEVSYQAGKSSSQPVQARVAPTTALNQNSGGIDLPYIGKIDIETDLPSTNNYGPDNVAVVIGNANYEKSKKGVPNVNYAHRDAEMMNKYLIEVLGFESGNILFVKDASYSEMASIFGNERVEKGKLANMVKPGISVVFVFYSGHGAPDADTKEGYLVPVDADPASIKISGFPTEVLYSNLSKTGAKFTTVVLDACFSGGSGSGEMLVKNASPLSIKVENPSAKLKNGAVFTASSGDQLASWYPDKQMGLFTYNFVKGMGGAADLDNDSKITIVELQKYLSDNTKGVPYLARKLHNRVQTPQVFSSNPNQLFLQLK